MKTALAATKKGYDENRNPLLISVENIGFEPMTSCMPYYNNIVIIDYHLFIVIYKSVFYIIINLLLFVLFRVI